MKKSDCSTNTSQLVHETLQYNPYILHKPIRNLKSFTSYFIIKSQTGNCKKTAKGNIWKEVNSLGTAAVLPMCYHRNGREQPSQYRV